MMNQCQSIKEAKKNIHLVVPVHFIGFDDVNWMLSATFDLPKNYLWVLMLAYFPNVDFCCYRFYFKLAKMGFRI